MSPPKPCHRSPQHLEWHLVLTVPVRHCTSWPSDFPTILHHLQASLCQLVTQIFTCLVPTLSFWGPLKGHLLKAVFPAYPGESFIGAGWYISFSGVLHISLSWLKLCSLFVPLLTVCLSCLPTGTGTEALWEQEPCLSFSLNFVTASFYILRTEAQKS